MAFQSRSDDEPLLFVEKTTRFFKIILEDSICNGKLMIPRRFVQKCGNDLPNHILIHVPNGPVWQVELRKCNGDVCLQKGWKEFAEYYSLAYGYLLIFEYKRNCDFHVLIFGKSATEIEYPLTRTHGKELDHDRKWQKTREKSQLPCARPHKMMRTNSSNEIESTSTLRSLFPHNVIQSTGMKQEKSKRNKESHCFASKLKREGSFSRKNGGRGMSMPMGHKSSQAGFGGSMQALRGKKKAKVLQRASTFKSRNPFFKVVIQPSYVHTGYKLAVPESFAGKYFTKKRDDVILSAPDGRTWSAKYYCATANGYGKAKIVRGWRAFAQENCLEVGDVCVFELRNVTEISFKVVIFRLNKDVLSPSKHGQVVLKKRAGGQITQRSLCPESLETGSKFILMHAFFKVVLQTYHLKRGCVILKNIPISFLRRNIKNKKVTVMLQVADRSWPVKLINYTSRGTAMLSAGWPAFTKDNYLQVGDVCAFQLIKSGVLKVSISRKVT